MQKHAAKLMTYSNMYLYTFSREFIGLSVKSSHGFPYNYIFIYCVTISCNRLESKQMQI